MISDDELAARNCLRVGSVLTHPRYLPAESRPYEQLKARMRQCWKECGPKHTDHWPGWVKELAAGWAKEGK
jgi:hypothetical protein